MHDTLSAACKLRLQQGTARKQSKANLKRSKQTAQDLSFPPSPLRTTTQMISSLRFKTQTTEPLVRTRRHRLRQPRQILTAMPPSPNCWKSPGHGGFFYQEPCSIGRCEREMARRLSSLPPGCTTAPLIPGRLNGPWMVKPQDGMTVCVEVGC